MKLFIGDKFFDSLIRLPRQVQNQVIQFQKKFIENTRSPALHLEPISTFKDQNLRTARVTQKYRAIIGVAPNDHYYLLWVDNHDEAMDWARGKKFAFNPATNSPQVYISAEEEVQKEVPKEALEEIKEKRLFEDVSDEDLIRLGVPEEYLDIVLSLRDLDELDRLEKKLPEEAWEHLFDLADGMSLQLLLLEAEENRQLEESSGTSLNQLRFFTEVSEELLQQVLEGELEKWQVFLHPAQRKLVTKRYKGPQKVSGGAGTGKTVVAIHRLKHLLEQNAAAAGKVVFCTYTNALANNLPGFIDALGVPGHIYRLSTIDSLAFDLAKQFKLISSATNVLDTGRAYTSRGLWSEVLERTVSAFTADFLDAEYKEVVLFHNLKSKPAYLKQARIGRGTKISLKAKSEIWALLEAYQELKKERQLVDRGELFNRVTDYLNQADEKPFHHVLVDEVQDFSNIELRFVRSLAPEGENDLFLVGDPYQRIYPGRLNFGKCGIHIRGKRSARLKINYRTTEEIRRMAISTVRDLAYDDFDGETEKLAGYLSLYHGEHPTYKVFRQQEEENEAILHRIRQYTEAGINANEMVVAARFRNTLKEVQRLLHQEGLPYYQVFDRLGDSGGVHLSTLHSLKGLEYKVVLLVGISQHTAPYHPPGYQNMDSQQKAQYDQAEKSLLYVAITRAVQVLHVTGVGRPSELLQSPTANEQLE